MGARKSVEEARCLAGRGPATQERRQTRRFMEHPATTLEWLGRPKARYGKGRCLEHK
jgi:hypothetical protein